MQQDRMERLMSYPKSQYFESNANNANDKQEKSFHSKSSANKLHYGGAYPQTDNRNSIELPQNTFEYNKLHFPEVDKRARINQSYDFSNTSSKSIPGQGLQPGFLKLDDQAKPKLEHNEY